MDARHEPYDYSPVVPWIEFKDQSVWDKVLPLGNKVIWQRKQVIQSPDDAVPSIFLIRSGLIRVTAGIRDGGQRTLWLMGPGSVLGEAAMFGHKPYQHCIVAMEDSEAWEFSREVVVGRILTEYPDLAESLLTNLSAKCYIMSTQVEESTFLSVPQRLGRFLYGLCRARDSRHLPLSHATIADLLGIHRVTVSNTISAFKRAGLLDEHTHDIVVSDIDALNAFLTGGKDLPRP